MFSLFKRQFSGSVLPVILGWAVCGAFCFAPPSFAPGAARGAQVVDAHIAMATDGAHPGSPQKAAIVASVADGYHINAHKPSFDYLIPTEVKFEANKAVAVERILYPAGKSEKLSFSDDPLSVYQGKFLIGLILKVPPGISPGAYTLKGKLDYQACNDRACLAPSSVPLALTVKVVPSSTPLKPQNSAVFRELGMAPID
ncbi:MAG: protein-disulfide reductase DsbD domain-containing protein [Terriglobia bacterium]